MLLLTSSIRLSPTIVSIELPYIANPRTKSTTAVLTVTGKNDLVIRRIEPITNAAIPGFKIESVIEKLTYFLAINIATIEEVPTSEYPIEAPTTPNL